MSDDKSKATPAKLRAPGKYRVTDVREYIKYPSDDAQLARMLKGENLGDEVKWRRAFTGQTVTDVPAVSVAQLLADGWIVEASSAPAAKDDEVKP